MFDQVDLPRAVFRGRYMNTAAKIEFNGTPIDVETLSRLRRHWTDIRGQLIQRIDSDYGVYRGSSFDRERFADFLLRHKIAWPRLESGKLALDDRTFREMSESEYKCVAPLQELRHTLSGLRLESLAVGNDGRNRCLLSAFGSKTGRNRAEQYAVHFRTIGVATEPDRSATRPGTGLHRL